MNKFRFSLIFLASLMIINNLISLDYNDLSWSNNSMNYKLLLSMICVIGSMVLLKGPYKKEDLIA
jgi:hypothetical protein